jgi:hypothetical protein
VAAGTAWINGAGSRKKLSRRNPRWPRLQLFPKALIPELPAQNRVGSAWSEGTRVHGYSPLGNLYITLVDNRAHDPKAECVAEILSGATAVGGHDLKGLQGGEE